MLRRLPSAAIAALTLSVVGAMSLAQPALAEAAAQGQLQAEITSPAASANVTARCP